MGAIVVLHFLAMLIPILSHVLLAALQNAQKIFRRLKKDMVNVEDLEPMLASLGVSLDSTIIQLALGCTQITCEYFSTSACGQGGLHGILKITLV